jgi:hypothetical protein
VFAAWLLYPFKISRGVELLTSLHDIAVESLNTEMAQYLSRTTKMANSNSNSNGNGKSGKKSSNNNNSSNNNKSMKGSAANIGHVPHCPLNYSAVAVVAPSSISIAAADGDTKAPTWSVSTDTKVSGPSSSATANGPPLSASVALDPSSSTASSSTTISIACPPSLPTEVSVSSVQPPSAAPTTSVLPLAPFHNRCCCSMTYDFSSISLVNADIRKVFTFLPSHDIHNRTFTAPTSQHII